MLHNSCKDRMISMDRLSIQVKFIINQDLLFRGRPPDFPMEKARITGVVRLKVYAP